MSRSVRDVLPLLSLRRSALHDLARALRRREGWGRFGAAFAFGSCTALAFAPVNFFPVFWLAFPALIFLLQGTANARQAFAVGWSFAFGGFLWSLYWIAAAMFVDIAHFWWAVPLAVAGLPAFLALYYGLAAALARRLGLEGWRGALRFALLWFLADYARGHLFTGFPWNLEGYAWMRVLPVLQIASVTGIYGLTLLTLAMSSLPACLGEHKKPDRYAVVGSLVLLAALMAWGTIRLAAAPVAPVPNVRLRLVQPDVDQAHKWAPAEREGDFARLLAYSSAPGEKPVTAIIWPETAATFYLAEDAIRRYAMAAHMPDDGVIITGVIRRDRDAAGQIHYYNSLIAVDSRAHIVASYDKVHLVPFGEYIPFRNFLPFRTLANLGLDFTPGDRLRSLRVPRLPPFSPLICYEAIFPGAVDDRSDRPAFLVNVTNDGWYGHTSGPYQHFAIARVRAIEEGLPLARAANTGVSGMVDPYGRIVARLGLGKAGFIDADLPQAIPPTLFSRYGETALWIIFVLLGSGTVSADFRRKQLRR